MALNNLINKDSIVFLETSEMKDTIDKLVNKAYELGKINNIKEFENAVLEREKIVSTGIGFGIAIPHSKMDNINDFFIIVGKNKKGLDWDAIDRKPVSTVFLIGGPNGQQKKYLKLIARLTLLIKNEKRRKKLFESETAEEIIKIFEKF
ncbi:MAG: PTS sugar transporter subunit IIA [Fusobacteriota bacterium]